MNNYAREAEWIIYSKCPAPLPWEREKTLSFLTWEDVGEVPPFLINN